MQKFCQKNQRRSDAVDPGPDQDAMEEDKSLRNKDNQLK